MEQRRGIRDGLPGRDDHDRGPRFFLADECHGRVVYVVFPWLMIIGIAGRSQPTNRS